MPNGDGSPRKRQVSWSADVLEDRLLLAHAVVGSTIHVASATLSQVAPTAAVTSHSETETSRSTAATTATATASDIQERDADQLAQAASASSIDSYTIPLILNPRSKVSGDYGSNNDDANSTFARAFRVSYSDEHIAWGAKVSAISTTALMTRNWSGITPENPESAEGRFLEGVMGRASILDESESPLPPELVETKGADLLSPFFPFHQAGLEQAIDRLIDGFETIGDRIGGGEDPAELIAVPMAWGIGLAAVELIRRRLRPREEADDPADRDPALGLRGSPG